MGIDNKHPEFSWKIRGTGNNIMQSAYLIKVATDEKFSPLKTVWQSGKVESDGSILQSYKGPDLKSGQRYYWQVKIWDNKGNESKWSPVGTMGNRFISSVGMESEMDRNGRRYIKVFSVTTFQKRVPAYKKCFISKSICHFSWFL